MDDNPNQDDVGELLRAVFADAADQLDADAARGRLLWASPDGHRCYVRDDTLTITGVDGPDYVHTVTGVDLNALI